MIVILPAVAGAVLGAIAGSFLSTIILRWPQGRGVTQGRSACDGCGRILSPLDLVPILSALVFRGRCRTCGARIDPIHGRMEWACAFIGALALGMMPDIGGIGWALFGWLLLMLAVLDWRHFWLPDAMTLPLAFFGLTIGLWSTDAMLADRVIGAVAGYGALLAISTTYRVLRGRDGLGLGDAKLLGALGAWLGWQALPFLLLIAALIGLTVALGARLAGRSVTATTQVPLGACMALAALPAWAFEMALRPGAF